MHSASGAQHDSTPSMCAASSRRQTAMQQRKNFLFYFGLTELILGIICCSAGGKITSHLFRDYYSTYKWPPYFQAVLSVVAGVALILSGLLGIVTRFKPVLCIYIFNLIVSILSGMVLVPVTILSCFAAWTTYYDWLFRLYVLLTVCSIIGHFLATVHATCSGVGMTCCESCCFQPGAYSSVPLRQSYQTQSEQVTIRVDSKDKESPAKTDTDTTDLSMPIQS